MEIIEPTSESDNKPCFRLGLPLLLITASIIWWAAFYHGLSSHPSSITEPPSSTSGLADFFIVIGIVPIAFFAGILGFSLGCLLDFLFPFFPSRHRYGIMLICCVLGVIFGVLGFRPIAAVGKAEAQGQEEAYLPFDKLGVYFSNGQINKSTAELTMNYDVKDALKFRLDSERPIKLKIGSQTFLIITSHGIQIQAGNGSVIGRKHIEESYLTEINYASVKFNPKEKPFLAILALLRATSRRAKLLIFDNRGNLIYDEKIDIFRPKMQVRKPAGSSKAILTIFPGVGSPADYEIAPFNGPNKSLNRTLPSRPSAVKPGNAG